MPTESPPLPRAHKKAAEAEGYTSLNQHVQARAAHEEAAVLFAEAERLVKDEGAKRALRALKAHQDRLALDSSRRVSIPSVSSGPSSSPNRLAASPFSSSPITPRARQGSRSSVSENGNSLPNTPPFALVPPSPTGMVGRTGLMRQASERAAIQRHLEFSKISSGGSVTGSASATGSGSGSGFREESESISGSPTTGSFMVLKDQKADPFQRFWNVVEGMLQEFSNPAVAFASAPLGSIIDPSTGRLSVPLPSSSPSSSLPLSKPDGSSSDGRRSTGKSTRKKVSRSTSSSRSSQDSFCLLPEVDHSSYSSTNGKEKEKSDGKTRVEIEDRAPSSKTREELLLENESLRLSLDALASHAYGLQQQQQQQEQQRQHREQEQRGDSGSVMNNLGIRSGFLHQSISPVHMTRLRKEVERVWRDEEERVMEASRLIGGTESLPADQQKIRELERQVLQLRMENERQRTSLVKFRERFDQIKIETRKKRELAGKTGG
ncbi:hypothetical protein [Phaffia rhodozyma]|uniref:Uncharacterized protein n=1 Tax=Phaffia rhodozyma TaxID=264483 RepID=A0A0F7STL5_PHARH|nr:hypothetical protein [Phaffia rhodozyma]